MIADQVGRRSARSRTARPLERRAQVGGELAQVGDQRRRLARAAAGRSASVVASRLEQARQLVDRLVERGRVRGERVERRRGPSRRSSGSRRSRSPSSASTIAGVGDQRARSAPPGPRARRSAAAARRSSGAEPPMVPLRRSPLPRRRRALGDGVDQRAHAARPSSSRKSSASSKLTLSGCSATSSPASSSPASVGAAVDQVEVGIAEQASLADLQDRVLVDRRRCRRRS